MSVGANVCLAGIPIQGEREVNNATSRLRTTPTPCSRVLVSPPTTDHHHAALNTGNLLVGNGSARITFTDQPDDGGTITLDDGITEYVFEFDSNGAYTAGRYPVTIGATLAATIASLVAAINAAMPHYYGAAPADEDEDEDDAVKVKWLESTSESAANCTITAPNAIGSTPVEPSNIAGYFDPTGDAMLLFVTTTGDDAFEYRIYG